MTDKVTINRNRFANLPMGDGWYDEQYLHSALAVRAFSDPEDAERAIVRLVAIEPLDGVHVSASVLVASLCPANLRHLAGELGKLADDLDPNHRWWHRIAFWTGYAATMLGIASVAHSVLS